MKCERCGADIEGAPLMAVTADRRVLRLCENCWSDGEGESSRRMFRSVVQRGRRMFDHRERGHGMA